MSEVGRMVSAMVGQKVVADIGTQATGPAGAMVGITVSVISRRLGPIGMVGLAIGMWTMHEALKARRSRPV